MSMTTAEYIAWEGRVCAHNYLPLPVVLHKGEGVWVWDEQGKRYLDAMSAYSALSLGHGHPKVVKALTDQAHKLSLTSRAFYSDQLAPFLDKLCKLTQFDMALPMNTGTEAVETAIKAARRWGYRIKKIPNDQAEIIVASHNFHGRTTTVISFSSEADYRKDFGPFTPGFKVVPFGDVEALKAAITPNTCAVLLEPIQAEAGIFVPPEGWLKSVYDLCQRERVLLVLDEIQTGLARTGKWWAYEHEVGVKPDIMTLGKALGGGVFPVSAVVSSREIMELFEPGSHGSTFGGNPLACAVGLAALEILESEGLAERAAKLGTHAMERIRGFKSPLVAQVRGRGLLIGIEIDPKIAKARTVCERWLERGVLTKDTHGTVVRLAPPLIIKQDDLDWALDELQAVLRSFL